MTEREFQRLMLTYGADIGRWPADQQAMGEKWRDIHFESRMEMLRVEKMDRLLNEAAPLIDSERVERAIGAVLHGTSRLSEPQRRLRPTLSHIALPQWCWSSRGAVYLGLFFLGCAANMAVRMLATDTPLDLWFSGNLSMLLGG
jgi:hypothetical protein